MSVTRNDSLCSYLYTSVYYFQCSTVSLWHWKTIKEEETPAGKNERGKCRKNKEMSDWIWLQLLTESRVFPGFSAVRWPPADSKAAVAKLVANQTEGRRFCNMGWKTSKRNCALTVSKQQLFRVGHTSNTHTTAWLKELWHRSSPVKHILQINIRVRSTLFREAHSSSYPATSGLHLKKLKHPILLFYSFDMGYNIM